MSKYENQRRHWAIAVASILDRKTPKSASTTEIAAVYLTGIDAMLTKFEADLRAEFAANMKAANDEAVAKLAAMTAERDEACERAARAEQRHAALLGANRIGNRYLQAAE